MSIAEKFEVIADAVYDKGVSDGKENYLDEMWEEIQESGNRKVYLYMFGNTWNEKNFKPKYDFQPTNAAGMFYWFNFANNQPSTYVNLKELLIKRGIKLDTSKNTNFAGFMGYAKFSVVPEISFLSTKTAGTCFANSQIPTIEKIIVYKDLKYENACFYDEVLENIVVEGEIGNTINFQWCKKLTKDSITSIVTHLSATATGQTVTFAKAALKSEFGVEITSDADIPTDNEFYTLRWSKPNWTFGYSN